MIRRNLILALKVREVWIEGVYDIIREVVNYLRILNNFMLIDLVWMVYSSALFWKKITSFYRSHLAFRSLFVQFPIVMVIKV